MTEKCYNCKTGHLAVTGSHMYCDKCNFAVFVMTQDYIDSCAILLGTLVSNTRFDNRKALGHVMLQHIEKHLPLLDHYLSSVVNGQQELGAAIMVAAEEQAINLQIGEEILNPEEAAKQLRCQCGTDDFHMEKIGKLVCKTCEAVYEYKESLGTYQPEFLCKCGWAAYEEEDFHIVACKECHIAYQRTIHGYKQL